MQNNPFRDPGYLAILAMSQGMGPGDAYAQAAQTEYQRQQAQALQQEQAQSQFMSQMLPQILQQLQGKSPQEIFFTLTQAGVPEDKAAVFAKNMAPNEADIKENVVFNPVTGEAFNKRIENGRITGFNVVQPGNVMQNPNTPPQQNGSGFAPPTQNYETPIEAKERRKSEEEIMKGYREQSKAFKGSESTIETLEKELPKFNTGWKAEERAELGKFTEFVFGSDVLGINPGAADNIKAATSRLLQPLLALQAGNPSDKDLQFVIDSMPQLTTSNKAKKPILEGAKALIARYSEKTNAAEAYRHKYGTLYGFESKWDDYTEANSILMKDKDGNLVVNRANIKNWRQSILGEANPQQTNKESESIDRTKAIQGIDTDELLRQWNEGK